MGKGQLTLEIIKQNSGNIIKYKFQTDKEKLVKVR